MNDTGTITASLEKAKQVEAEAINALARRTGPHIAVINNSSVIRDGEADKVTEALQIQMSRDFVESWGLDATLDFVPMGGTAPSGHWHLVILDNSPQADALGFHDLTAEGLPIGKIFAKSDIDAGASWSVTASHELLELRADPDLVRCVLVDAPNGGRLYALEVGDAPEADEFGYRIGGVLVSDFVYPSWFESFQEGRPVKFDHMGHISKPFQILPGGYTGYLDINSTNGWQQLTADLLPNKRARAPIGSRRERRRTPRNQWLRSTR